MVSEEVNNQIAQAKDSRPDQTGECLLNDGLPQPLHVVLRFDGVSHPLLLLCVETGVAALERNEQVGDQQGAVFWCHCEPPKISIALVTSLGWLVKVGKPIKERNLASLLAASALTPGRSYVGNARLCPIGDCK